MFGLLRGQLAAELCRCAVTVAPPPPHGTQPHLPSYPAAQLFEEAGTDLAQTLAAKEAIERKKAAMCPDVAKALARVSGGLYIGEQMAHHDTKSRVATACRCCRLQCCSYSQSRSSTYCPHSTLPCSDCGARGQQCCQVCHGGLLGQPGELSGCWRSLGWHTSATPMPVQQCSAARTTPCSLMPLRCCSCRPPLSLWA